jgi:hypothetical protein
MRVRIRKESDGWWAIEVKKWYWPFWVWVQPAMTKESALAAAHSIKYPTVTIEIK